MERLLGVACHSWGNRRRTYLLVAPDLVGPHVGGVEVLLVAVKDHAVDGATLVERGILHVRLQTAI